MFNLFKHYTSISSSNIQAPRAPMRGTFVQALVPFVPIRAKSSKSEEKKEAKKPAPTKKRPNEKLSVKFILSKTVFPHQTTTIHIFDPRYLLLIEKLTSDKEVTFGVVPQAPKVKNKEQPADTGTLVKIISMTDIPEGKCIVVQGQKRFRVSNPKKDLFGFWFQDNARTISERRDRGFEYRQAQLVFNQQLQSIVGKDMKKLEKEGRMPKSSNTVALAFWLCGILPDDVCNEEMKIQLLSHNLTTYRLKTLCNLMKNMKGNVAVKNAQQKK